MQNDTTFEAIHPTILGVFNGDNPFKFSFPTILFQASLSSLFSAAFSIVLKPLGFPLMVPYVLAGQILGPSVLGRIEAFRKFVLPGMGYEFLLTTSRFGLLFEFFLVGLQVSPAMMLKARRKAKIMALATFLFPVIISYFYAFFIVDFIDPKLLKYIGGVVFMQTLVSFPSIASYLSELNILNSEISRLAFSSSMITGMLGFGYIQIFMLFVRNNGESYRFENFFTFAKLQAVIFCIYMPVVKKIVKRNKIDLTGLSVVLFGVIMLCDISSVWPQTLFAIFIFGLIIPSGTPLGAAIVSMMQFHLTWINMPLFHVETALSINLFTLPSEKIVVVGSAILIIATGKFLGAFLSALYCKMTFNDAILLGLTMNLQGFVDISLARNAKDKGLLDDDSYAIMYAWYMITTACFTPLIQHLHKLSTDFKLQTISSIRSIQHAEAGSELRILACIYQQSDLSPIIDLLKASNPTKKDRVIASIIHFVELVGHATPFIISHKVGQKPLVTTASSQPLLKVLRIYEEKSQGCVVIHPYTVVSPYVSMQNDVCTIAHKNKASLIILPYHKDLVSGEVNAGIGTANCNVLSNAPCSVGIVIDFGILSGCRFPLANWASYRVAVIFIGGCDDREALALGSRMCGNPTIELTVIRISLSHDKDSKTAEKILDDEMVTDFELRTEYNQQVFYREEVVNDGMEAIKLIESTGNEHELVLLGRRHDKTSPLIVELTDPFNKCSEVGTIGDVFLTTNYEGKATTLVLQQHTKDICTSDPFHDEEAMQVRSRYDC